MASFFEMIMDFLRVVPVDQKLALLCQAVSVVAACVIYRIFGIKNASVSTRHIVCSAIGVTMVLFCYGVEAIHLFLLCGVGYLTTVYPPRSSKAWLTFAVSVCYVLAYHMYKYIYQYMEFPVEAGGSLMIMTIKISSTACSVSDGYKPEYQLTKSQLKRKITTPPAWLEYFSYCFCFLGILFGPSYFYSDYVAFIEGKQYKTVWPLRKAITTLLTSCICLGTFFVLSDMFRVDANLEPEVMAAGVVYRHVFLYLSMFVARCKYYFCWLSSEAACYFCGLGYDETESGPEEWGSSIPTVKIMGIEFATSLKMFADSWNMFTGQWLQFCIYERVVKYRVLATFAMSAIWHGFYPGYYLMFGPLALAILLGRKLRRTVRPYFQSSMVLRNIYHVITWFATAVLIAFNSSAFELRSWDRIMTLHSSFYFWPHILVVLGLLIIPNGKSSSQRAEPNAKPVDKIACSNGHSLHSG